MSDRRRSPDHRRNRHAHRHESSSSRSSSRRHSSRHRSPRRRSRSREKSPSTQHHSSRPTVASGSTPLFFKGTPGAKLTPKYQPLISSEDPTSSRRFARTNSEAQVGSVADPSRSHGAETASESGMTHIKP